MDARLETSEVNGGNGLDCKWGTFNYSGSGLRTGISRYTSLFKGNSG
jgi:hypothetical protein